ncbi:MAG: esterase-like activity of phytase family protein, partial [Pseudomonadota bacterium]
MIDRHGPRAAWLASACLLTVLGAPASHAERLQFIGEATLPTGFEFGGTEVGGLSGLDYNRVGDFYYALSDDRSSINDARYYTLTIDLADGSLDDGDVTLTSVITLLDADGLPFEASGVDPEAIRHDPRTGSLYWTSEGDATVLEAPFVREMNPDGSFVREFETPGKYAPSEDGLRGIRNNLAFESLTFAGSRTQLVTATENALVQDGPSATVEEGSPSRILVLDLATGEAGAEFIYTTDPVAQESDPPGDFKTNGLVE